MKFKWLHFKGRDTWIKEMFRWEANNLEQGRSAELKLQAAWWWDLAPGETFRTEYLVGPAASPFRNQHWEGCGPGWWPYGQKSAALLCLCGARSRYNSLAPHPTSRVSRVFSLSVASRALSPVSAVPVLMGPQDGNLTIYNLTALLLL